MLCGVFLMLLAACANQDVGIPGQESPILVKESPASTTSTQLDSTTLSGEVYVVLDRDEDVTGVRFFVNDLGAEGEPFRVDDAAPFDMALDTRLLEDGPHAVRAEVIRIVGAREVARSVHAGFDVNNTNPTAPIEPGDPEDPSEPSGPTDPGVREAYSLRGDPAFAAEDLSGEAGVWYRRVWDSIEHPDQDPDGSGGAHGGSLRSYGYEFQQHMHYLFTALRATGDPKLVDEIARLGEIMAGELTTKWYDSESESWYPPTDGTRGLRRWVYLRPGFEHHTVGTDTNLPAVYKTHAMVATLAYALHVNRDLESLAGHEYGELADFFVDYLVNDFEQIQHVRRGTSHPENVFRDTEDEGMSVAHSMLTYHWYMHKVTGEPRRLKYATGHAEIVAGGMWRVDTAHGDGLIFAKPRDPRNGLVPIVYARYTYALQTDLHLDGHPLFASREYMEMHANSLAHFVMDNGAIDFAFDVGGMKDRRGVSWLHGSARAKLPTQNPYTSSALEWGREAPARFAAGYFTPLGAFASDEARGKILTISEEVFVDRESDENNPRQLAIPVGMLLASVHN